MVKRLAIVVFCIGLMTFWSTDAKAWPATSSGWAAYQNTVTISSGWRGIANKDLRPTSVKVTLFPNEVMVLCRNHGGNEGGAGNPFIYPTTVTGSQATPDAPTRNGRWDSNITFTDNQLLANLGDPSQYCINPNWDAYGIVVKTFDVYIQAYEDINETCEADSSGDLQCYTTTFDIYGKPIGDNNAEEVVHIQGSCDLGSAPIGEDSSYTCDTDLQWEYSKTYPTCDAQFIVGECEVPW